MWNARVHNSAVLTAALHLVKAHLLIYAAVLVDFAILGTMYTMFLTQLLTKFDAYVTSIGISVSLRVKGSRTHTLLLSSVICGQVSWHMCGRNNNNNNLLYYG